MRILEAVKQNGFSIYFIVNPSEAVQIEAVKQNQEAIKYIENHEDIKRKIEEGEATRR